MEAAPRNQNERRGGHRKMRRRAQIPPFGNWDYSNDRQQHFVYPYAQSYSPGYTCYVDHGHIRHFPFHAPADASDGAAAYDNPLQHHFVKIKTSSGAAEVKGPQSRPNRRRRSYLGADNNRKVFVITETEAVPAPTLTDKCYGCNDVVVAPDLYDVASANVTARMDEDLYKIPPELLRKSRRTKKLTNIFTKCFVTICASY